MKILAINTFDQGGGAAAVCWSLKQTLETLGHQVSLLVAGKRSIDPNVQLIPQTKWQHQLSHYLANDLDFPKTDYLLKSESFKKADLVHFHNLHGNYFNLRTFKKICSLKPVIWTFHDLWPITPFCAHAFEGQLKNGFYQCPSLNIYPGILWHNEKYLMKRKAEIYRQSDFSIVVPSLWLKERVTASVLGNKDLQLIYNGIDTSIFKPDDKIQARKELNLPFDKKIVLMMGLGSKDDPFKGWQYAQKLIEYYKNDDQIIFINVGGNQDNQITNKVVYLSYISDRKELAKYYSAADVLLFPSLAENFPLTILQAMSSGLPIVSFDVGGVKETLEHQENGYLAKYRDLTDLINGLDYIFSLSPEQLQKMANQSREKIIQNFTVDIMTKKYLDLYQKLINRFNLRNKPQEARNKQFTTNNFQI